MDLFAHRAGRLWCEDVPLDQLADRVGTPAYVYSLGTLTGHVERLRAAFEPLDPFIAYAMKANASLALLARLRDLGLGFDIVSGGELDRLVRLGVPGERIVFSGVGKTREEMGAALRHGIRTFNVEGLEEIDVLADVAAAHGLVAPVALRVNPDVEPCTHRHVATGRGGSKFGIDLGDVEAAAARVARAASLRLVGLQCHIGSQITSVEPFVAAARRLLDLADRLRDRAPDLATLDVGGGFGIWYRDAAAPGFEAYAEALRPLWRGRRLALALEPGRVLVGNAGVLLTRVLYRKQAGARRYVVVDAGMNDLLRPSLYEAYHRIWPAVGEPPPPLGTESSHLPVDVVGPVCEGTDFLAKDRALPPVAAGDLLVVSSAGAYGFSMASQYNARPRPVEVVVEGDRYAVARRRETYDDLVRGEDAAPSFATLDAAP